MTYLNYPLPCYMSVFILWYDMLRLHLLFYHRLKHQRSVFQSTRSIETTWNFLTNMNDALWLMSCIWYCHCVDLHCCAMLSTKYDTYLFFVSRKLHIWSVCTKVCILRSWEKSRLNTEKKLDCCRVQRHTFYPAKLLPASLCAIRQGKNTGVSTRCRVGISTALSS